MKKKKIKRRSIAKKWKNTVIIITVVSYTTLRDFSRIHTFAIVIVTATYTLTQLHACNGIEFLTRICNGKKKCERIYALMRPITVLGQGFFTACKTSITYDSNVRCSRLH